MPEHDIRKKSEISELIENYKLPSLLIYFINLTINYLQISADPRLGYRAESARFCATTKFLCKAPAWNARALEKVQIE